jgi:RNAse (barnase) inhibitor barstar
MLNPFINTLWPRKGDDTFPATQIGQKFALLRGHLEEDLQKRYEHLHKRVEQLDGLLTSPDANQPIQESIRELRDSVIQASANFKEALKRIDEILSEFRPLQPNQTATEEEFRKRAEVVSRAKESLEGPLRFVALLETDHKLEKRLER